MYPFTLVRVVDGDTLVVHIFLDHLELGIAWTLRDKRVRVYGVDTPERGQPGYSDAAALVRAWLAAAPERMLLECYGLDKYGRILGDVLRDGERLSDHLIIMGAAEPLTYRVSMTQSEALGVPVFGAVVT